MVITQAKFTYEQPVHLAHQKNEGFVLCNMSHLETLSWTCEFNKMSLYEISRFIVEFFSTPGIPARKLTFTFMGTEVSVAKTDHYTHENYLEIISKQTALW